MSSVYLKCSNNACPYHEDPMMCNEGKPPVSCPICQSKMEDVGGRNDGNAKKETTADRSLAWLTDLAEDENYWVSDAETAHPSVMAYEYRNLRRFCREGRTYAALLCMKDNFEALLKLEVLLSFAWAARNGDDVFEKQTVSRLMTPNPSLGTWVELASVILKDLKKAGMELPESIPLDKISVQYIKNDIVHWRNEKIGHGAMGLSEDEEFREDIREKVMILKELCSSVDIQLREQELFLPKVQDTSEDGTGELILTGADMARGLSRTGQVHFRTADRETIFCVDPFITIRKHEKNGYGIYYFDNQRTRSLTYFLSYPEGSRASGNVEYFERLRKYLESTGIKEGSRADDIYLSEDEIKEMDLLQMSHNFVKPEHLVGWLKMCLESHDRGVFMLQMERGTGKSVFTEKMSGLTEKPIRIFDDLDVRTYHLSRTQTAGSGDVRSGIEWLWSKDYEGKTWARAPRISDFERQGMTPGEALSAFLEKVLIYSRRNRRKELLLMIFDGLDEITEEDLWKFIPEEEMLGDGIYILLTSRNPATEKLTDDISAHLNSMRVTGKKAIGREGEDNTAFLKEYIGRTQLKGLADKEKEHLVALSDHRVLQLGLLCRLAESGMGIGELPDSSRVVSVYLDILEKRYGEKGSIRFRELLAILCTLGTYEGLTLRTLGALTGENGITLNLIGMVRDLAPMLKAERGEEGNLYTIANTGLSEELEKQIPETEDTVRWTVNLAMSVMRDGNLDKEKGLEAAAAHIVELAEEKLPEGLEALGSDADDVLWDNTERNIELITSRRSGERLLGYIRQLFMYRMKTLGEEHPHTLESRNYMAVTLSHLGRYEEALAMGQEVYEKRKKVLGEEHPDTLLTLNNMGSSLSHLGRYEEAMAVYQEAYEKRKRVFGGENPNTLNSRNDIADILLVLGHYEKAMAMYQKLYKKRKKVLGEEHPDTLRILNNMALILGYQDHNEKALKMHQDVYEKRKKALGEEDRVTLETQNCIANQLINLGRYEEALDMHQDVYEKRKKVLGEEHPDTLTTLNNIALTLGRLGHHEKAIDMLQECYEKKIKALGEEHPDTLLTLSTIAWILEKLGRYEEALDMYKEVYEKRKKVLGGEHPDTLATLSCIAFALVNIGRNEDALTICKEVYEKRKKVLGGEHPNTLATLNIIAMALVNLERYEEALAISREMYRKEKKIYGKEHSDTLLTLSTIARILEKLGRYEEALAIYRKEYRKEKKIYGKAYPRTLSTLCSKAEFFLMLKRYKEALAIYRKVYRKEKKIYGKAYPETLSILRSIVEILITLQSS